MKYIRDNRWDILSRYLKFLERKYFSKYDRFIKIDILTKAFVDAGVLDNTGWHLDRLQNKNYRFFSISANADSVILGRHQELTRCVYKRQ